MGPPRHPLAASGRVAHPKWTGPAYGTRLNPARTRPPVLVPEALMVCRRRPVRTGARLAARSATISARSRCSSFKSSKSSSSIDRFFRSSRIPWVFTERGCFTFYAVSVVLSPCDCGPLIGRLACRVPFLTGRRPAGRLPALA